LELSPLEFHQKQDIPNKLIKDSFAKKFKHSHPSDPVCNLHNYQLSNLFKDSQEFIKNIAIRIN
jgi:hypothetical protein